MCMGSVYGRFDQKSEIRIQIQILIAGLVWLAVCLISNLVIWSDFWLAVGLIRNQCTYITNINPIKSAIFRNLFFLFFFSFYINHLLFIHFVQKKREEEGGGGEKEEEEEGEEEERIKNGINYLKVTK